MQKKKYETHSPTNQISKDETRKKINYTKGSKKIIIKRKRVKIEL
jgi:hypothetical protein